MTAHLQGPPRSTVADAIGLIVAHYAATATRGVWAPSTAYAAGDTVGSAGALFLCYAPGTSDSGPGPSGVGSQADTNGVGWTPVVYVGERYLRQHGAPPRLVIVPGNGTAGDAAPGVKRIGDGNVAGYAAEIIVYVWGAETVADLTRYAAVEDMIDAFVNMVRKVMPGRATLRTINPTITANVVTFGEDRQIVVTYQRSVPRDAAIMAVPVTPAPTLDPMRPNGDLGTTITVDPAVAGSR